MTYYTYGPRYDLSKPVNVKDATGKEIVDANGKKVQQLDRWGEPVYEVLKKKEIDANGNEVTVSRNGKGWVYETATCTVTVNDGGVVDNVRDKAP